MQKYTALPIGGGADLALTWHLASWHMALSWHLANWHLASWHLVSLQKIIADLLPFM